MSDNKAPSYPWYPRDFAADEPVQLMSLAEEGAYRRLLDHQWLHGSIPGDIRSLARICKNIPEREMRRIWATIEPLFSRLDGQPPRLQNRKLERVRKDRNEFIERQRESGSRGGKARWERERERLAQEAGDSEPTGDPSGEPTQSLVAESYPAVAIASASAEGTALLPLQGAVEGALREVTAMLPEARHETALRALLRKAPNPLGFLGTVRAVLDGLHPMTPHPTPAQVGDALADLDANGKPPEAVIFRAYCQRAAKPKPGKTQSPVPATSPAPKFRRAV